MRRSASLRHADKNYKYKMIQQDRIIELDHEDHIKDLGVLFDENLDLALLKELIKPEHVIADQKEFQRYR